MRLDAFASSTSLKINLSIMESSFYTQHLLKNKLFTEIISNELQIGTSLHF
jgi:hypothetical protein